MFAFPSGHNPKTGTQQDGMTLRDYFAAKAIGAMVQSMALPADVISEKAYAIADAMLYERNKNG